MANGKDALPVLKGAAIPGKFDELGIEFLVMTKNQEILRALTIIFDKDQELQKMIATLNNEDSVEGSWRTDHDSIGRKLRAVALQHRGFRWLRNTKPHQIGCQWRAFTKEHAPHLHRVNRLLEAEERARLHGPNGEPHGEPIPADAPPPVQPHEPGNA